MENLKIFNTQEEYQTWKDSDDYVYPNVCKIGEEVVYNNYPDYFWIEALEDLKVWQGEVVGSGSGDRDDPHSSYWKRDRSNMYYSSDKEKWTKFTYNEDWAFVRKGEKMYFKSTYIPSGSVDNIGEFYIAGKCNIGGSILSLIYGDDYLTQRTSFKDYIFSSLFLAGHLGVGYNQIIGARELILPNYISQYCYGKMFLGCKDLIKPPRLPSKNAYYTCYGSMFSGCASLVQAPTLPAIATGVGSYTNLFNGCSSLSYIKMLSTTSFGVIGSNTNSWSENWVKDVSPTGTFIANSKRTDFTRGVSGIPEGWDLYLYDEDKDRYVVKFKVNDIPYEYYTDEPRDVKWSEFIDSEQNTNDFRKGYWNNAIETAVTVGGKDNVLLSGKIVNSFDNIVLNASYTIGQPTETTEVSETTNVEE